jgi:hypothetical protein
MSMQTAPNTSAMRAAMTLIDSGSCVWCESAPATATSYLCDECSSADSEGMLAKPFEAPTYGAQRTA